MCISESDRHAHLVLLLFQDKGMEREGRKSYPSTLDGLCKKGFDVTKDELISAQALEIAEQKAAIEDLKDRLHSIKMKIVCIGGPLNDNKHGYTKDQMLIFWQIKAETEL